MWHRRRRRVDGRGRWELLIPTMMLLYAVAVKLGRHGLAAHVAADGVDRVFPL